MILLVYMKVLVVLQEQHKIVLYNWVFVLVLQKLVMHKENGQDVPLLITEAIMK